MQKRLKRVSHIKDGELPFTRKTFYKFYHLKRYPSIFVKIGGALFVDLDQLDCLIEAHRQKK